MNAVLTKFFPFSASREAGGRVFGHNYILGVTIEAPEEETEARFVWAVEERLVRKLESRDLGLDVDFLKGRPTDDRALLAAFWDIVERAAEPLQVHSLSLERDKRTVTTLAR